MNDLFEIKRLSEDIVEVILNKRTLLDTYVTDKIEEAVRDMDPDRMFYQLVLANAPYSVDPEMRQSVKANRSGVYLKGVAWVSPDEKANQEQEKILSNLPLPFPIRFFTVREKGLAWLEELAGKG